MPRAVCLPILVPAILSALLFHAHTAHAETRVSGEPEAVHLEARDASLEEILDALAETFGLHYRATAALSRRVTGTYRGSLQRVVKRLLDGYDFVIKTDSDPVEVRVYGTVNPDAAHSTRQAVQTQKVAPAVTTKTTRAARRARRGY